MLDLDPNILSFELADTGELVAAPAQDDGRRPGEIDTGDSGTKPSEEINRLLDDNGWLPAILAAVGAVLIVFIVIKTVLEMRKNNRNRALTTAGIGLLGVLVLFRPGLIGVIADIGINILNGIVDFIAGVF